MTHWPVVKLAELCRDITVGHVGKMSDRYVASGVPFLRSQDIEPNCVNLSTIKFIPQDFHRELRKSRLRPGDVVMVRTGYPGTAAVVPVSLPDANCADLVIARPGPQLDPHFLAYSMNSPWGRGVVRGSLVGVAQQHFNVKVAANLRLPSPPLPIQRRIASILGAYDDLIEVNRRRIAVLEEMARRLFDEWFVHFRFPGHEGHKMVETEHGRLPEGWRLSAFSEIASFVNGYAFKPSDWGGSGLPIVKIKELKEGVTAQTPRYASEIDSRFRLNNGDILFSWSADLDAYVWAHGPAWLNQHLFLVRPYQPMRSAFLFLALRTQMPRFRALSQGTTMRHIKRAALDQVRTVVPSAERIEMFESVAGPMVKLSVAITRSTQRLAASRDLLLPRLISGDLSVAAAERELETAA